MFRNKNSQPYLHLTSCLSNQDNMHQILQNIDKINRSSKGNNIKNNPLSNMTNTFLQAQSHPDSRNRSANQGVRKFNQENRGQTPINVTQNLVVVTPFYARISNNSNGTTKNKSAAINRKCISFRKKQQWDNRNPQHVSKTDKPLRMTLTADLKHKNNNNRNCLSQEPHQQSCASHKQEEPSGPLIQSTEPIQSIIQHKKQLQEEAQETLEYFSSYTDIPVSNMSEAWSNDINDPRQNIYRNLVQKSSRCQSKKNDKSQQLKPIRRNKVSGQEKSIVFNCNKKKIPSSLTQQKHCSANSGRQDNSQCSLTKNYFIPNRVYFQKQDAMCLRFRNTVREKRSVLKNFNNYTKAIRQEPQNAQQSNAVKTSLFEAVRNLKRSKHSALYSMQKNYVEQQSEPGIDFMQFWIKNRFQDKQTETKELMQQKFSVGLQFDCNDAQAVSHAAQFK